MRYTQRNLANEIISSLCSQRVLYTYEYEVGVNNDKLRPPALVFILSFSSQNCHLPSGLARAPVRLSLGMLASWPPVKLAGGHFAAWQLSPVGPSTGGHPAAGGGGRTLPMASGGGWPDPRGSGSSAVVQSDPIGIFSDTGFVWILIFHWAISTFVRNLVCPYEKLV